eukprot:scaffold42695_cov61-Attheya_sp.AAC.2
MSDGAGEENVQDPDDVMNDGSMVGDDPEEFGDDASGNFSEDFDMMSSMEADGRHYVFPPELFVVVPMISMRDPEYQTQLFRASYEFMAYYQKEHFAQMGRISGTTFQAVICCQPCRFGPYGRTGHRR